MGSSSPPFTILWSTQGGRAKACARRTARILRGSAQIHSSKYNENLPDGNYGCSFDDFGSVDFFKLGSTSTEKRLVIMFVSTTGDAEQCDSIKETWRKLLQKSTPNDQFENVEFALFCLGDRAYGPQAFCAAGRKLAARMMQLSAKPFCDVGYGDDGTPNGGVFADLDVWLETVFLKKIFGPRDKFLADQIERTLPSTQYEVRILSKGKNVDHNLKEWEQDEFKEYYDRFFASNCPATSYHYKPDSGKRIIGSEDSQISTDSRRGKPLLASITCNERITSSDWHQDTRHVSLHVESVYKTKQSQIEKNIAEIEEHQLPYHAGDIATIIPSNPKSVVSRFISCLPQSIQDVVDDSLEIIAEIDSSTQFKSSFIPWPKRCTLRGILTYCADICSLPEREDLRALSFYCNPNHPVGNDQRKKLISLSETADAALYGDYIIREKRNWADILFDFDSIKFESENEGKGSSYVPLTIDHLLMILAPIIPRHFSIASAPSKSEKWYYLRNGKLGFNIDLCVAVVKGRTRYGRPYQGLCSTYLSSQRPSSMYNVRVWIRPGSFQKMPLDQSKPILFVGAGTGVAPLRSLIQERLSARKTTTDIPSNILVFGCRKQDKDFYYKGEWERIKEDGDLRLITAFSQDQRHKLYVQKVLREADGGAFIAKHILERGGAVYIAGGAKMARAVKDEIIESLAEIIGEKTTKTLLGKLQRTGQFSVEAWS